MRAVYGRLAVLLVATVALSLTAAFLWVRLSGPSDGALLIGPTAWTRQGVLVTPLVEQPGELRRGDVVTAVAGRTVETWVLALPRLDLPRPRFTFGQSVTYTVLREGRPLELQVTLGRYPLGSLLSQEWGTLLFLVAFQAVASFVFIRRPDETAARILFLAAAGTVASVVWSFELQVVDLIGGVGYWLFVVTSGGGYLLLLAALLHLALIFPRPLPVVQEHPWLVPVLYAVPYGIYAASLASTWVGPVRSLEWLRWSEYGKGVFPLVYFIVMLAALVTNYRRNRVDPVSRLQIRWIVFSLVVAVGAFLIFSLLPGIILGYPLLSWSGAALIGLAFPVALAVAILRYRLFDIDIIINRTLVYGLLTAIVIGLYVLGVSGLGSLLPVRGNLTPSLIVTGLVAVLFQPLRERLQRAVNRLMYGERDEPYAVLSRLGQRLEATLAPEAVLPAIVETVAQALKLPYAAIALKQGREMRRVASYGLLVDNPLTVPLTYQSEQVGELILGSRGPGDAFTPADHRLLGDLARQAGVAVHGVRLWADLQRSRERLVTAREEERRRLRRDLHDGLGPTLAGITLKLDAARNLLPRDPLSVASLLEELKAETQGAIAGIRRLVYDLRPPALDELGLLSAVQEHIAQYRTNRLHIAVEAPARLPPLPAAVEVAAYRIVQEALANVVRHAGAQSCRIILSLNNGLEVEVADDGIGLPEDRHAGVGLVSMRERAEELGGTCVIERLPGRGTRVRARLPLAEA